MNQKKCPKCGENNPPEAVMCWACYTPLTGGAVAPATAGGAVRPGGPPGAGVATMPGDAGGAKVDVQPWMYAVGGVVLLVILVVGAKVLMGGGEDPTTANASGNPASSSSSSGYPSSNSSYPSTSRSSSPLAVPAPSTSSPSHSSDNPGITQAPYTIGALPNPESPVGIVGIAPVQALSPAQGGSLAKYAVSQFANVDHWGAVEVFVFQDQQGNQQFKDFQTGHKNQPLSADDFNSAELSGLWPQTSAVYVFYKGGKERVIKPGTGNWYEPLLAQ